MFAFYSGLPEGQRPVHGDTALFKFIATELPTPIPGLILSAMLAAIMSTLDSGINSLATVAVKDFYLRFYRPGATEREQVIFSRLVTLVTGLLAILIGLGLSMSADDLGTSVLETSMAWMSLSVALPPVFLLGMLSRRATPKDALVQLVTGWLITAAMLLWHLLSRNYPEGGISFMMVGIPGPVLSLGIGWMLSRRHASLPESTLRGMTFRSLYRHDGQ
jgi:SSS family solute:Na+ symporter